MAIFYNIEDIPATLLSQVGGKARGLHRLAKAGFTVPQAFIVTDIHPEDTLDEAVERYHTIGYGEVSVRSSATLEDGNDYSAAGQFSTFLNVSGGDNVRQAIFDCVASLNNATALNYAKTFLQSAESQMTVVVQRMVDARCAGVIFTAAPMRPGFSLVEAVPGLGENLVSGKMSAQQYRVRGNHVETMPGNSILTREQAIRLVEEGKRIEALFGQPMDLEWAIDQDGTIQWLQARPITVEESVTVNELDCPMDVTGHTLTTGNIGEVMPGAVTPLNLSTNMYALDWGVMETYLEIGAINKPAKPYTYLPSYYNHMFFDMTSMYTICHACFGTAKDTLDVSICGKVLPGDDIEMKVPFFRKLRNTAVFMKIVFGGNVAKKGMDETIDKLHFDLDTTDMKGLYQQILDMFPLLGWVQYYHYRSSYYSGGQSNMLIRAVRGRYENDDEMMGAIAGCFTEIDDFESANVLRRMRDLAGIILQEKPDAACCTPTELDTYIREKASPKVVETYKAFMEKHGHRGIREMEIRNDSWRSNPESFFVSLKSVMQAESTEANLTNKRVEKSWTDYADELLSGFSRWKRKSLMKSIMNARKGVCYREYTKSKVIYALDLFKQAYQRLADLMVQANLLPDTDCIYFLTQDEVGKLLDGNYALVKKAIARRRFFPQQEKLIFAECSLGIPAPMQVQKAQDNVTAFQGTPVSRGTATGKARVVLTEEDAAQLQAGEIMVAACTDIGWTPYYNTIAGLVTEIGSALSHGIVVAREFALPSVVNVENVIHNIRTGDQITIDGNTGSIFINKRAA